MPFDLTGVDLGYDDLVDETTEQGRWYYTPSGEKYPSITTVLSHGSDNSWLQEWKERVGAEEASRASSYARNRGTDLHRAIETYITAGSPELPDPIIAGLFESYRVPIDNFVTRVYGLELALYSSTAGVAGRADLVADFKKIPSIIDYKTSKSQKEIDQMPSYWMQTCFYALAFYERTGIKIDQLVILIKSDGDPVCEAYTQRTSDWVLPLFNQIQKYQEAKCKS